MARSQPDRRYMFAAAGCALMLMVSAGAGLIGAALMWGYVRPEEAGTAEVQVTGGPSEPSKGDVKVGLQKGKPQAPESWLVGDTRLPEPAIDAQACDDMTSGGGTDGCITGEITCDQVLIGHTIGGVKRFDTAFYRQYMCWPDTVSHDGGDERVYRLTMPPGEWKATVTLDSPCADLDLMAFKWSGKTCPGPGALIDQCECNRYPGKRREFVELVSQSERETTWYVVVEGAGEEEGTFALQMSCKKGLH